MEEAKTLSHIQTYPMVYISKEDLDDEIKDERGRFIGHKTFDEDGNVIPIICVRAPEGDQIFLKDVVASVTKDDRLELGFNIYDIDYDIDQGYMNKTREDEKIVLVYTFMSGENMYSHNSGENPREYIEQDMAVSFITNYGNIVSGILYRDDVLYTRLFGVRHISSFRCDATVGSITIDGILDIGRRTHHQSLGVKEFIYKPFPERQCYVPQLFVDVIATFLQYTNRKCGEFEFNDEEDNLLIKFKELCYNYNTRSIPQKKIESVVEYAPEIPVKMTYPIIQIEDLKQKDGLDLSTQRPEKGKRFNVQLTLFGGNGEKIKHEHIPGQFGNPPKYIPYYMQTKEDEKVVFIDISKGDTIYINDHRSSLYATSNNLETYNYLIITNYGFIHTGCIADSNNHKYAGECRSLFLNPNGVAKSPQVLKTYNIDKNIVIVQDFQNYTTNSIKLIPNTLPDYPKVPKLFVDVLSSVLNKDQEKFHKLCGEYTAPPPNEELKEINEILQEEKEKLIEENRLLREKIENTQLKELNEKIIKKLRECEKQNEKLNKELIIANQTIDRFENKNEELTEILIQKSDELKELKEELFGLKSFYNLPLAFKFRR